MSKPSGGGLMIAALAAILAVLAAGSYSAGTERFSGSLYAAGAFAMRDRCLENSDNSIFVYPGTDKTRYKGEYRTFSLPVPLFASPQPPADLAANPFIEPISVEPVWMVYGEQIFAADGQGCLYDCQGRIVYEGSWQNGYPEGRGIDYFDDGRVRYEGGYVRGLKQGTGRLFIRENDRAYYLLYQGEFAYECFHGQGIMYSSNGEAIYSGRWYYGEPVL